MGYRPIQVFTSTFASGVTSSAGMDLGSEGYEHLSVFIPAMASSADFKVLISDDNSSFYNLTYALSSGTTDPGDVQIISTVTSSWVPVPDIHHRYVKMEFTTACTAVSGAFKVVIS